MFLVTCLSTLGCGGPQADYSGVDLIDVSGCVKLDGQAVPDAVIILEDMQTGLESYALTDESGDYRIKFDSVEFGALAGEKRVIISTTLTIPGLNTDDEGGEEGELDESNEEGANPPEDDLIPAAYRTESKLRATVTSETTTLNFDLAPDGSTTGPTL